MVLREKEQKEILDLAKGGMDVNAIVKKTGHHRSAVNRCLANTALDIIRETGLATTNAGDDGQSAGGQLIVRPIQNGMDVMRAITTVPQVAMEMGTMTGYNAGGIIRQITRLREGRAQPGESRALATNIMGTIWGLMQAYSAHDEVYPEEVSAREEKMAAMKAGVQTPAPVDVAGIVKTTLEEQGKQTAIVVREVFRQLREEEEKEGKG